ncbi:hypothetical protein BD31_I2005, partial [Candidatus Nitrosopumilus salaria BD31]
MHIKSMDLGIKFSDYAKHAHNLNIKETAQAVFD